MIGDFFFTLFCDSSVKMTLVLTLPSHIGYLLKDLCVTVNAILDDGFNIFFVPLSRHFHPRHHSHYQSAKCTH